MCILYTINIDIYALKIVMYMKKKLFALMGLCLWAATCCLAQPKHLQDTSTIDGHPSWIMQGNIYEVNVRQYTPEGTFKAFAKHLERLKAMGVQTLWFMPINPISVLDRKGVLGSYYAISNYTAINPEYGTLADWNALVKQCHSMGFKVIIDWVANHTGADHYWLKNNPDFYVQDSITHKPLSPFDWTDARKLNYSNPTLCDSMIACMSFWLKQSNIDGFRCDVASEVPAQFWKKCIAKLKKKKPVFMLAEADVPWIHEAGFDASYTWTDFAMMCKIAKGERKASALDSTLNRVDTGFKPNALRLFFTSNHDENSWNKADYGTMPGDIHAPFAVLTQTVKRSVSLFYSGQEEPFLDSLSFFYKDTISFGKYQRADFYKLLLNLRKENSALASNAAMIRVKTKADDKVFAFIRQSQDKKVLVVLNLSKDKVNTTLQNALVAGEAKELFSNATEKLKDGSKISVKPWGYKVYVY